MGMLYKRGGVLVFNALVRTRAFPSRALSRVQYNCRTSEDAMGTRPQRTRGECAVNVIGILGASDRAGPAPKGAGPFDVS